MDVKIEVERIRAMLKNKKDYDVNPIDVNLPIIPPFVGGDNIKLIVIGQDPTIQNVTTRKKINYTLNLDKKNALSNYLNTICEGLGIQLNDVYATNVFKYFYSIPPAGTIEVLENHLEPNLELLKAELAAYENIPVITLGEPVFQLLTNNKNKLKLYWNYDKKTGKTNGQFLFSKAKENKLARDFFPFPHQPSLRKAFYGETLRDYVTFLSRERLF